MKRVWIVTGTVLLCVAAMGQGPKRDTHPPSVSNSDQQEIQSLSNDVSQMRTLLQQMQMNLAFVQNTQTPLKHQFELEIDMWRMVLDSMERRLQRLRGTATGGVALPVTVPLRQSSRQEKP